MATGKRLFISYSRRDGDFTLKLAQDLRRAGVEVWMDRLDMSPGVLWDREVDQALRACGRLLVILSPDSAGSESVMDEVAVALHEGKPVASGKPNFHSTTKPIPAWQRPMIYAASAVALILLAVVLFKNFASQSNSNTSAPPHSQETKTQPATIDKSEPKPSKEDKSGEQTKETPSFVAPSTDRDHPAPLASNEVRGTGVDDKRVRYYYSFLAGPGEVKVTFDYTSGGFAQMAYANIFDEDFEKINYISFGLNKGESSRESKRFPFSHQQKILVELDLEGNDFAGSYLLRVEGAVQFE